MESDIEDILDSLERRKLERLKKDSETYKIMARVFDSSTLLTLYHLINRGVLDVFYGVVSAGKEANVFCALDKQGNYVAVKIYRIATSNFKSMHCYLASDPRFKRVPPNRREIIYAWTSREFKNMQRAHEAGVPVPRPIDYEKNVLAMEFLGEKGVPYPRMKDRPPRAPKRTFDKLFNSIKTLYQKAGLIHSDFSEYNVLLTPDPVLIDFSMGTDRANQTGEELLMRDIGNLSRYFRRLGVKTPEPAKMFENVIK